MTGPVTTEALVEKLAHELARLDGWQDPNALWTDNLGIIARGGEGSPVYLDYAEDARALVAGPLAPLLAAHQQVTAERDEAREVVARCNNSFGSYSYHLNPHPAEQIEKVKWQARSEWQRADAAEASLATATSEIARLRAEGEAKDSRIAVLTESPQVVILQLGEEERRIAGEAARAFRAFLSDPRTLGACSVEHYGFSRPDGGVRITTWSNLPGVSFVNGRFRHSSLPGREYAREEIEAAMIPDLEEIARAATAREGQADA